MAVVLYQLGILNFSSLNNGFQDFGQRKRRQSSVWTFKICQHLILSSMSSILIWDPWLHIAIYLELFAAVYSCTSALVDFSQIFLKKICVVVTPNTVFQVSWVPRKTSWLYFWFIYTSLEYSNCFFSRGQNGYQ